MSLKESQPWKILDLMMSEFKDIHEEMQEEREVGFLQRLSSKQKVIIGLIILAFIYLFWTSGGDFSDYWIVLFVGGVLIFFMGQSAETKIPLSYWEVKAIVSQELLNEQRVQDLYPSGLPKGLIEIGSSKVVEEGERILWRVGVSIRDPNTRFPKHFLARVDYYKPPYGAGMIGLQEIPDRYRGD